MQDQSKEVKASLRGALFFLQRQVRGAREETSKYTSLGTGSKRASPQERKGDKEDPGIGAEDLRVRERKA